MKKKIIIIGGGFAGLQLVKNLDERFFDILLLDKLNHHQFQPLFYQVATSQLEPASISFPLRHVFKSKKNVQIRLAEVEQINTQQNEIQTNIGTFNYDYLIIATGCKTNYFGNTAIEKNSFSLKTTYEAIQVRNHILLNFEKIISATETEKESLLNLVIVGAGPTGVELAGAFAEIKKNILPKDYPNIDFSRFKVYLIEGSPNTLNNMSDVAKESSKKYIQEMGVELITQTFVQNYDGNVIELSNGEKIKTKTVIWAAGVTGNAIKGLSTEAMKPGNRIAVNQQNVVVGYNNVFAVGDIAYMPTAKYPKAHPQVANVAINQAKTLAKNLKAMQQGKSLTDFEYKDLGTMATIGKHKAVVDLPFAKFKGYFAWVIWMFLHLMLILSVRNKLIIFINWAWAYITKDTSLRLILTKNTVYEKESTEAVTV